MLKVFLSSHGRLASGMASSVAILMGQNDKLTTYDAYVDETSLKDVLDAYYETVGPEDQVLLLSDIYGGSVNQTMYQYLTKPNTRLVAGVNLTLLMSVLLAGDELSDEALENAIKDAREYLQQVKLDTTEEPASSDDDFF